MYSTHTICRGSPTTTVEKKITWIELKMRLEKSNLPTVWGGGKWGGRSRILDDDDGDDDPETWQTCQEPQGIRNWGKKPRSGITFDALLFSVLQRDLHNWAIFASREKTHSLLDYFLRLSFFSLWCVPRRMAAFFFMALLLFSRYATTLFSPQFQKVWSQNSVLKCTFIV